MSTLGGFICVRNALDLDYCFREAINSMLPICDEVVVSDGASTDGTRQYLEGWTRCEPKLKIVDYPWPNPKGDVDFWVNWMNWTREYLTTHLQLELDADEVLSERSYPEIEAFKQSGDWASLWAKRYNFWADAKHLIPPPECCSDRVVRIAPQNVWLPSDGAHEKGNPCIEIARESGIEIFHYGFLRKPESFFRKARALQGYFFDSYDSRLAAVENNPNWMKDIKDVEWTNRLVPYTGGPHPAVAIQWLRERGYG